MPSLSVPSRFKPRHRDISSRLRGRRKKGGAKNDGNGKKLQVAEVAFALFPELQVRPKVLVHNTKTRNDAKNNNNNNNNAETAVANSGNLTDTTLDSTSSQPHSKTRFWRMQQPFSEVAPYLGSFFNIHCACVDIDHVLDVEEEFENQVFLQAKAARILKRKAVDMKQLKFGRQLGQGGKDFIMTHTYIEYAI